MIFNLDQQKREIHKRKAIKLADINWKEDDLQKLMFSHLHELLPEEELLLIMQSKPGKEEPDLMAIDKEGTLYIFELKAWESKDVNLLQALRYGQIYGQYNYSELNTYYKKRDKNSNELLHEINLKFNTNLQEKDINNKQQFILVTNGIDIKTRSAILYWQDQGINITSWIYKIYDVKGEILLDFETFLKSSNIYEDIVDQKYFILNTNTKDGEQDERDMLTEQKAAAYDSPWIHKIEKLQKGHYIFLYSTGKGIIAKGIATGKLLKKDHDYRNEEEYYMKLNDFEILEEPISPSEIKRIANVNYRFMQTMFSIDEETGKKLWNKQ